MKRLRNAWTVILGISLLIGCGTPANSTSTVTGSSQSGHVTIQDLSGQQVSIPKRIQRISAIHPIATYLLWRLAPNKLASVDMVFKSQYLSKNSPQIFSSDDLKRLKGLPVTGVFFKGLNPEQLLQLNPDVLVDISKDPKKKELADKTRIPLVSISKDKLDNYEQSIRLIGNVVGNESDANKLADYWTSTISEVTKKTDTIPENKRVRVYYANAGVLSTPGKDTVMASIIKLAGGNDLAEQLNGNSSDENLSLSLEQVLKWNPQVIIVTTQAEKEQIMTDPGWSTMDAVKNKRVYVESKYAFTDGIIAIMGLVWAQGEFYHPGDSAYQQYFNQKMASYYLMFFNYHIQPNQIPGI